MPDIVQLSKRLTRPAMWQWSSNYSRGTTAHAAGRLLEAELNFTAALHYADQNNLTDDCKLSTMQCLAWTYRKLDHIEQAEQLCQRALAILEQTGSLTGSPGAAKENKKDPAAQSPAAQSKDLQDRRRWQAKFLNIMGSLRMCDNRMDDARLLYERALEIEREQYGDDHPGVTSVRDSLTVLAIFQSDLDKAEALATRSVAASEKLFGKNHPALAMNLQNLAYVYSLQKRAPQAEAAFKRALDLFEGKTDQGTGIKEFLAPKRFDGDTWQWRMDGIYTRSLGEKNPIFIITVEGLAELYMAEERYLDAEPLCKRALAMLEQAHGPSHPNVATALERLAKLHRKCDRFEEALLLEARAQKIREDSK